jgi:hypothetical protein
MTATLSKHTTPLERIIAVDWSGTIADSEKRIWLAEADPATREVVRFESGCSREVLAQQLITEAPRASGIVAGLVTASVLMLALAH